MGAFLITLIPYCTIKVSFTLWGIPVVGVAVTVSGYVPDGVPPPWDGGTDPEPPPPHAESISSIVNGKTPK
jgi:hypothetical protein